MKPEPRLIAQIMYRKRKAIGSRLVNQLSCSHVKGWKHVVSRLNRAGLIDVSETRARAQKKTRHSGSRRETLRRVSVLEHQSARNITNHLTDGFFSIFSGECNISAPPATLLMSRQWRGGFAMHLKRRKLIALCANLLSRLLCSIRRQIAARTANRHDHL